MSTASGGPFEDTTRQLSVISFQSSGNHAQQSRRLGRNVTAERFFALQSDWRGCAFLLQEDAQAANRTQRRNQRVSGLQRHAGDVVVSGQWLAVSGHRTASKG